MAHGLYHFGKVTPFYPQVLKEFESHCRSTRHSFSALLDSLRPETEVNLFFYFLGTFHSALFAGLPVSCASFVRPSVGPLAGVHDHLRCAPPAPDLAQARRRRTPINHEPSLRFRAFIFSSASDGKYHSSARNSQPECHRRFQRWVRFSDM